MRVVYALLLFLENINIGCSEDTPTVEFVELFGKVILEEGSEVNVTCEASGNEVANQGMLWRLGNRTIEETGSLTIVAESRGQASIIFHPSIEDDYSSLTCESGGISDSLLLRVWSMDIFSTSSKHKPAQQPGEDDIWELEAKARAHPRPSNDSCLWIIQPPLGGRILLRPGQQEDFYHAHDMKAESDFYVFKLELKQENLHMAETNISFSISVFNFIEKAQFNVKLQSPLLNDSSPGTPWYIWLSISGMAIVFLAISVILISLGVKWRRSRKENKKFISYLGNVYLRTPQNEGNRE